MLIKTLKYCWFTYFPQLRINHLSLTSTVHTVMHIIRPSLELPFLCFACFRTAFLLFSSCKVFLRIWSAYIYIKSHNRSGKCTLCLSVMILLCLYPNYHMQLQKKWWDAVIKGLSKPGVVIENNNVSCHSSIQIHQVNCSRAAIRNISSNKIAGKSQNPRLDNH